MGCCGDRRAALARNGQRAQLRTRAWSRPPTSAATAAGTQLRYVGPVPMVLRGPVTGTVYRFAEDGAPAAVAQSDQAALLRTDWFERQEEGEP